MDSTRAAKYEGERQFYLRVIKFMSMLMVFFALLFASQQMEHSDLLFIGLCVLGVGFLLYMIASLAYAIFVTNSQNDLRNILTEEELAEMQQHDDEEEEDNIEATAAQLAEYPMEETPKWIRSCREPPSPFRKPKNGRYNIVYNAVYFGKSIRSESQLQLTFEESHQNHGWEVRGDLLSGDTRSSKPQAQTSRRCIADGFVNPRGEMYWKLANPDQEANLEGIYRGVMDLQSCAMYDGEFKAGSAPPGRIVRMEFIGEMVELAEPEQDDGPLSGMDDNWGSPDFDSEWSTQDVEMVTLDKSIV